MIRFAAAFSFAFTSLVLTLSPSLQAAPEQTVPVQVVQVQQQPILRQVDITGSVTSPQVANLSPSISGLIIAMNADEGDRVATGSTLVEMDSELAKLRWQSAQATVTSAESEVADAKRRLAEAQRLESQRSIAKTVIKDLQAEVIQKQANLQRVSSDAKYQQALLERHQLKAPFPGVISQRVRALGEWVTPGDGVLQLVATEKLRLDFAVSEDYLSRLRPDARVMFRLNALGNETFEGKIHTLVPVTNQGARTFLLRVNLENADPRIIPGMSASASLHIPTDRNNMVVPRDAILRYPDGRAVVWGVYQEGDHWVAREYKVQPGEAFAGLVEIQGDLPNKSRVVVRGNESLRAGQRVSIVNDSE